MLEKFFRGMGTVTLIYCYCVNKLMIHFIKNNEDKIKGIVTTSVPSSVKGSCVCLCYLFLEKTGRTFCVWMESGAQKELPVMEL